MTRIASGLLLGFVCLVFPPFAFAQAPLTLGGDVGGVNILADHIEQVGPDLTVATGNVEITRGATRLTADRVEINRETGEAVALGKAIFYDGQDRLIGDRMDYNLKTGTGVIYDGSAFSAPYHRISGERMERVGEGLYNVRRGVFTNCEADPPFWSFRLGQATADLDDHIVGRDASFWLEALKVPLIPWVPFFAAPIRRERQTGFLLPTLGNSNEKGFFARIPFYWAISDSQDATFALDPYSKRGPGADLEYRYILSETNRGEARGFGIQETERGNDTRGRVGLKHDWQVTPRWSFKADLNYVSDDQFLREYADRLSDRSLQRVQSTASASWRGESWNLVANGFWYQDLTTTQHVELQRLPEIRLQGLRQPVPGTPLLFELQSGYTNFVRDVGSEGQRADLHPRMLLPLSAGGFFTLTPFVGGRGTLYDKTVVGSQVSTGGVLVEVTEDTPRTRALGEAGADLEGRAARLFDAGGALGISRLQHLIEPRVNYTFVDGVNRNKLPQYEPGGGVVNPLGIPLAEIGIDRIPKLSRFTFSLTNRLNAKPVADGGQEGARWELVRFALGQTYDFFPPFGGKPFGNVTGELTVQPSQHLRFRGNAGYDVYGQGFQSVNTDVSAMIRDVTATAGTRFDHSAKIEFVTGQIQAKLTRNLDAHSSIQYDVQSGTPVEMRFGLDILCQCVSFTLEYVRREGSGLARNEDEVHFSVNLLGLGRVGSKAGLGATQ